MDWLMKYSECKDTGLRVCEVYEHLLVREDGMVRNVNPSPYSRAKKEWWEGNVSTKGYMSIGRPGLCNVHVMVHRAVALAFIDNPLGYAQVNHINHDTSYNDISNLEWCNNRQNCSMKPMHKDRLVGTTWCKLTNKWKSRITVNGKTIHIGVYDTEQCAHDAYIAYKALHNII